MSKSERDVWFAQVVRTAVRSALDSDQVVVRDWMTREIIMGQGAISGEGCDFYTAAAYRAVRAAVDLEIRAYEPKLDRDDERQMVLPGYKHLQVAYAVVRDGSKVAVPIKLLSDDEVRAKRDQLRLMARGAEAHADELDDYLGARAITG